MTGSRESAVARAAAHFDPEQLVHWQELALRALPEPDYLAWASELIGEEDPELLLLVRPNLRDRAELTTAVAAIREALPDEAAAEEPAPKEAEPAETEPAEGEASE